VLKRIMILTTAAAVLTWVSAAYGAATLPQVKLRVAFRPDQPGQQTTVAVGFRVRAQHRGELPPPLIQLSISLPAGMGLGTTDLGEATCSIPILKNDGPERCPHNSVMGKGYGVIDAQFGQEILREPVALTIVMAKALEEHTTLLFQAEGWTPTAAEETFVGQLLGSGPGYGARLVTDIPLVTPAPGAGYAALESMYTTFGPEHLTYYRRKRGVRVPYKPQGIVIPPVCPRGGYRFAVTFTFLGVAPETITAPVRCKGVHRVH